MLAERAERKTQERATLRGLQGVQVLVEDLRPEVERAGLTKQQLTTDVELQLRKAGIRVFAKQERLRAPGQPWLYVNVNTLLLSNGLAAYNISVVLNQRASLDINTSAANVVTWHSEGLGTVGVSYVSDTVRKYVRDHVDRFINAYLSVNPRPAGSAAPASASPRRDLVRQAQERLQAVGFNPGTIDGSMGPQTQQALRWLQNAQGLLVDEGIHSGSRTALGASA